MYLPVLLTYGPVSLISQGKFPSSFNVNGQSFRCIILAPQFYTWPSASDIDQVINYAIQHYKVDINRIYLSGVSMRGGVTWDYTGGSLTSAKRIAAIVPIAGASYPDQTKANIIASANLPVWALHNDGDPVVPSWYTTYYINYINSSPTPPNPLARKTIFHNDIHDSWTAAYDPTYTENGLNVYQWMLQYSRNAPAPNQPPVANAGAD